MEYPISGRQDTLFWRKRAFFGLTERIAQARVPSAVNSARAISSRNVGDLSEGAGEVV